MKYSRIIQIYQEVSTNIQVQILPVIKIDLFKMTSLIVIPGENACRFHGIFFGLEILEPE